MPLCYSSWWISYHEAALENNNYSSGHTYILVEAAVFGPNAASLLWLERTTNDVDWHIPLLNV